MEASANTSLAPAAAERDHELLVAEARERAGDAVRYRELVVEAFVGGLFVAAATALMIGHG